MRWSEQFTLENRPNFQQITDYIDSPLWEDLCAHLEGTYGVSPLIEYSKCGGAPGWNVKYKKSGRSLCTLYPNEHFFTSLVSIGSKEAMEAELLLISCDPYVQELYERTALFNGSRWMMIDVTTTAILEDVKRLIALRVQPKKMKK